MPRRTTSRARSLALQWLIGTPTSSGRSHANATMAQICSGVMVVGAPERGASCNRSATVSPAPPASQRARHELTPLRHTPRRLGVVQFIKGAWQTGEKEALERFGDQVAWHTMGEGFTWETQDLSRDIAAAERAFAKACELMEDPAFGLVILDELNIALRYDYLDLDAVVETLSSRRPGLHVVVTGRNAKDKLVAAADLVTEMGQVKHHFAVGVKAQAGIEF